LEGQAKQNLFDMIDRGIGVQEAGKPTDANQRAIQAAAREVFAACRIPAQVRLIEDELEQRYFNSVPADPDSVPGVIRKLAHDRIAEMKES